MNLPNKLTLLRVFMVPIFLVFALITEIPYNYLIAVAIFAIASATDALDGHIARKNHLVTNFGKFLDPLADKVLVMAAMLCLVDAKAISSVPVIIILAREFMVSGLRLVTANDGIVVPAGILGKLKTAFTMIAIIAIYVLMGLSGAGIDFGGFDIKIVYGILIWIAAGLTIISGAQYLWAYRKHIDTGK
ncbi:MAG: CDP-diacylglycerol--glycerol-3-phosphate 3-phosphatidyltransferase [Oscillospiraceae bacterium]